MRLQEQILKNKMTAKEVAKNLNVDEPTISRFVNYKCLPIPSMLEKICNVLNCNISDIYNDDEIYMKRSKKSKRESNYENYKITVRLPRDAKGKIHQALQTCGYKDVTYWIYRCYERLMAQYEIIEKAKKKERLKATKIKEVI